MDLLLYLLYKVVIDIDDYISHIHSVFGMETELKKLNMSELITCLFSFPIFYTIKGNG